MNGSPERALRQEALSAPSPLSEAELLPIFERAKHLNNHCPQMLDAVGFAMLHAIFATDNPERTLGRHLFTYLPEEKKFADAYGAAGTAAHKAKGMEREITPADAMRLWELEKQVLVAVLIRVFFRPEDYRDFKLPPDHIAMIRKLLADNYVTVPRVGPVAGFNKEFAVPLWNRLEKRMKEDAIGREAVQIYAEELQQFLTREDYALTEYRNGFAKVYADYLANDEMTREDFIRNAKAHVKQMREKLLLNLTGAFVDKQLDPAVLSRLLVLVNVLRNEYDGSSTTDAPESGRSTEDRALDGLQIQRSA